MKRRVESWSIEKIQRLRPKISFPEYQRQPNLWPTEKKRLLIDSILRDIDIPKLYFNETATKLYEVVDGTQRLWSIWEFLDDEFALSADGATHRFSDLSETRKHTIRKYELQVTVLADADDEYLRQTFVRLQLGLLLVTGEKLNAATGMMKDFVFRKLARHDAIEALKIPNRRYAKATLGAQLAINSFSRAKVGVFARTRYEDLLQFFELYRQPAGDELRLFKAQSKAIVSTLDEMSTIFGSKLGQLGNRSYFLSIFLFFEGLGGALSTKKSQQEFVEFVMTLWRRLREEAKLGMDRTNRELYSFETMLSSAPGERYQIERRHNKLTEYFEHYKRAHKIKGDK